jgi:hypothetical protein
MPERRLESSLERVAAAEDDEDSDGEEAAGIIGWE